MRRRLLVTAALLTVAACSGEPTSPAFPDDAAGTAHSVKFWEAGSSVHWNARAVTLFRARGGPAGRMLIHYRFDMVAGETLGLAAGRLALQRGGLE
jgi:hypothetical protein